LPDFKFQYTYIRLLKDLEGENLGAFSHDLSLMSSYMKCLFIPVLMVKKLEGGFENNLKKKLTEEKS